MPPGKSLLQAAPLRLASPLILLRLRQPLPELPLGLQLPGLLPPELPLRLVFGHSPVFEAYRVGSSHFRITREPSHNSKSRARIMRGCG